MTNPQYQRKFRTKTHQSVQQQPSRHRPHGRRRSIWSTVLMLIGAAALFVLLMRYVIVPLLVLLPQWLGGAA